MRNIKYLILLAAFLYACKEDKKAPALNTQEIVEKKDSSNLKIEFGKVSRKSVFRSEEFSNWGGSLVKGEDNLYHMFYSRWAKKFGWEWVTMSEIAHATSQSPFGPFTHKDVALPMRDDRSLWDGTTTHNPTIHKFDGKYYLYYMGNTGDLKTPSEPGKLRYNWMHRNNQRIGVAIADSPNGPWKRFDTPVIDVSKDKDAHDALMASNPSVCKMPDGKILMVYKAVGLKKPLPGGGPVVHLVAIADSPTGPFKKYPNPVFTVKGEDFPAEDPYIWYQDGKYRAIVKRMASTDGKQEKALIQYDSEDGINWNEAKHFQISDKTITWEDGIKTKFDHLERPQLYFENGEAKALLCAADSLDANNVIHSFNIQIPIKVTEK